jgi:glutaconate CoA-transferase subunit B
MVLTSLHPGVSLDDVRSNLGWEPRVRSDVATTTPPTAEELRVVREELDPHHLYL